ncbi:MAG: hydratase [Clostridia bacterium]|nr:hydratase [Clostridia bacterium]
MVTLHPHAVLYRDGAFVPATPEDKAARTKTMAYPILTSHSIGDDPDSLAIRFDAMASHDITYVGIIQTARASGLTEFPLPYVLTNCHNSLCAVGGTINEDDHAFGLSAAKKYGGIYVPAHQAVIHSYMRENFAGCGKMILGSDSHTRYGALGTMAIGEGGPELVKQLLKRTYDIPYPEIVAVRLTGKVRPGVGPQDVALALIGKVFESGFVKNRVLEFVGEGIKELPIEFRNGIDVMTTETTCLSSIWITDEKTKAYLENHQRGDAYKPLSPEEGAYYDRAITIDLSKVESMIALPFHPSNVYTVREFLQNADEILASCEKYAVDNLGVKEGAIDLRSKLKDGKFYLDQGVIAGCAGGIFDNLAAAADILAGKVTGSGDFSLSVYPASGSVMTEVFRHGIATTLVQSGATLRSAFCGPCFGAGDVPKNNGISLRHTTRNFPMREGAKPKDNQIACVALADARTIAATAANGGVLTPADSLDITYTEREYRFDKAPYEARVYNGYQKPLPETELVFGPNITDWPTFYPLADKLLLSVASLITDKITTTDELIPSGDTSSYRSNPEKLSSFALSRKDPAYVGNAKRTREQEANRRNGKYNPALAKIFTLLGIENPADVMLASVVMAERPGDGSAREQAASCQRVLGGVANIALEYATKRYRSNLINWGMLPFTKKGEIPAKVGDYLYFEGIRKAVEEGDTEIHATLVSGETLTPVTLYLEALTKEDRDILLDGCLINYYKR